MAQLSGMGVAAIAYGNGVPLAQLPTCVAIAWAESGLRTDAVGHNGPTSGCPDGSYDRGLWQINSCYHSEVSEACAFDANCNARAMFAISSRGTNWHPWSTYNNGAYARYLPAAQTAIAALNIGVPIPAGTPGTFSAVDYAIGLLNQGKNPFVVIHDTMGKIFEYIGSRI